MDEEEEIDRFEPDPKCVQLAIEEAKKCVDAGETPQPKAGVVVVKDGVVLAQGHRGAEHPDDHGEFAMLDALSDEQLAGATVYATFAPCSTGRHPELSCTRRLIQKRVARVVVGIPEPWPGPDGHATTQLAGADISVRFFPSEAWWQVQEINADFIRANSGPAR